MVRAVFLAFFMLFVLLPLYWVVITSIKPTSDYLVVTMTDASVISYEMHHSPDEPDVIEDKVGFAYKKIKFVYDDDHETEMNVATGV